MTASRNFDEAQNEYIEKVKLSTYFDKIKKYSSNVNLIHAQSI